MTLDKPLPGKILNGEFFEVGVPGDKEKKLGSHWTTFKATKVSSKGGKSEVRWLKDAKVYSGRITSIETMKEAREKAKKGEKDFYPGVDDSSVFIHLGIPVSLQSGNLENLVISSEDGKRVGICKKSYDSLICDPATVSPGLFKAGERIKLYEIGVGHTVRFTTRTSLIRVGKGKYKLSSNVPFSLTIKGKKTKYGLKDLQNLSKPVSM